MKTVVQRVTRAEVHVGGDLIGRIARGLLLFVGVEKGDVDADADATARKVAALRIFPGRTPMDLTVADVAAPAWSSASSRCARRWGRETAPASSRPRSRRAPSRSTCASPTDCVRPASVETGRFGADMAVELVNDGPVTFWIETRDGALVK